MWVFGYGSLMWNPGFEYAECIPARLYGYERSFCMRSIHHRGTIDQPGLVLALDKKKPDNFCDGMVFGILDKDQKQVLQYLRERELISSAYLEQNLEVIIKKNAPVKAVTFVVDNYHEQYVDYLSIPEKAKIIGSARGEKGCNVDYLQNTANYLEKLEIRDDEISSLRKIINEDFST